ncbi:rhodanese-like domain-containing protein [Helicobacter cetorum]|uniref:Rhodanese-related sulfur transferase n=1 Tax=Helicobacter cetorum (strain ATCC BAA-429 / MIT 00-7128) TaxID=182217 RepID=I0EPA7_HELC0|nr:rhodanese-like domain-containing protein [Helicobacter cetorum]AFI04776.1 rhodanese-related sulfur transferase [Helicobacter cetorum MIT 00-7128]
MDFLSLNSFKNAICEQDIIVIDVQENSFFHGFKKKGALRGGHVPNALHVRYSFLEDIQENAKRFLVSKGIDESSKVLLYGEKEEIQALKPFFSNKQLLAFENFIDYQNDLSNPLEKLHNYHWSVSPSFVYKIMQSQEVAMESYQHQEVLVFEVGHSSLAQSTECIQGAHFLDTDLLESAPLYNLKEPSILQENLSNLGITKESFVVLYSQSIIASMRAFWALKCVGIKEVRFLDGGLKAWKKLGLPTSKYHVKPKKAHSLLCADLSYCLSLQETLEKQQEGYKLVSIRSWGEYQAYVNDYDYIERKGEIPGALWGFSGNHYSNTCDFYNPDNTLRNPYEIYKLWEKQGFNRHDKVVFYCSTGWRGAIAWFYALWNGWENAFLCDGGWHEYQSRGLVAREHALDIIQPSVGNDY